MAVKMEMVHKEMLVVVQEGHLVCRNHTTYHEQLACKKLSDKVLAWLSVSIEVQVICILSS